MFKIWSISAPFGKFRICLSSSKIFQGIVAFDSFWDKKKLKMLKLGQGNTVKVKYIIINSPPKKFQNILSQSNMTGVTGKAYPSGACDII